MAIPLPVHAEREFRRYLTCDMARWGHGGGFSVDAAVRTEAADQPGWERLLRDGARPPFALERLQQRAAEHLLYAGLPGPAPGRP